MYQDAKQRKAKKLESVPERNEENKQDAGKSPEKEAYIIRRFEKEFENCFEGVDKENKGSLNNDNLLIFCQNFGCISNNCKGEELNLIKELYELFEGKNITKHNLLLIMKVIMKISLFQELIPNNNPDQNNSTFNNIHYSKDDEIIIPPNQIQTIHKKFYDFYLNKRYTNKNTKEEISNDQLQEGLQLSTFKPQISAKTEKLAARANAKRNLGDNLTIEAKLLKQHKDLENKKDEQRRRWEEEEINQVFFISVFL